MTDSPRILITGAAGFIGSSLVTELNRRGYSNLILVDNFHKPDKEKYLAGKTFSKKIISDNLFSFLDQEKIDFVFHLGGKTSYKNDFTNQNLVFPQNLYRLCNEKNIPFVYASTSSTYGAGEHGYDDDESRIKLLQPLDDYGVSKNEFDKWILNQPKGGGFAGLKIFNVYGPNEYHKGASRSVAFKSYFEIKETGKVVLYGSSTPSFGPGDQQRDFIYVKDVIRICCWFLERWLTSPKSFPTGIYNTGTGIGRSFNDVARAVFKAMDLPERIEYKPIPENILSSYRESVIAPMGKLFKAGFNEKMFSLEEGVRDLVQNYLSAQKVPTGLFLTKNDSVMTAGSFKNR